MKIIVDKIKENRKIILYSFFLTLLFFGINYKIEYATDTYYNFAQKGAWIACLDNGRPFLALCFYVLESLPISVGMIYHIMQLLGIIFLTITVSVLAITYNKYLEKENISIILAFLTVSNPLIIEYFLFEEKGIFMMAIFLNVEAALLTEKMWSEGKMRVSNICISLLCMLIAVLSYQSSTPVFVVTCLPFVVIHCKDAVDFIKKNVYIAIMYGFSMGCAFAVAKFILHTERATMSFNLIEGIGRAAGFLKNITFDKFANLPKGIFTIWCLLIIVAIVLTAMKAKVSKLQVFLSFLYIWIGCTVVSFFVFVLNGSALASPRTVYSYGMIFGVVLFYSEYINKEDSELKKKVSAYVSMVIAIIILGYEFINFGSIFIDRYQCNEADRYYAEIIREQIRIYEDESGNKVDTICFYNDQEVTWWDGGYGDSEMMTRAQSCGWSALNSINLYLGRNYKDGEPDEDLIQYFKQFNWGMYSEQQVIFRDNELHLCVY